MTFHQQVSDDMLLAFPTPVLCWNIQGTEALNQRLRDLILARVARDGDGGVGRSNVGGWHSGLDFFDWPHEEVRQVRQWARDAVLKMMAFVAGVEPAGEAPLTFGAWANVLEKGGYNVPHSHPNCTWSGIYYVDTGGDRAGEEHGGVLEFLDPRPGIDSLPIPGDPFHGTLRLDPLPGMLLLFPSWLLHFVHAHQGSGPRISIAFNVTAT